MPLPDEDTELEFEDFELETDEEIEEGQGEEGEDAQDATQDAGREDLGREGQQLGRPQRRIQVLANRTKEAELKAARLEAQNEELRRNFEAASQRVQQQQYDPRAEQEALAAMDPIERMNYQFNRTIYTMQQQQQFQQFQMHDMMDKSSYDAKAAVDPVYKRFEGEVEQIRLTEMRKGRHFPREEILAFVVGQQVLKGKKPTKSGQATPKKKPSARAGAASSDVGGGSQRGRLSEQQARAKRLENMKF
jgi:hypothetical protein